jgi:hypothetical protein
MTFLTTLSPHQKTRLAQVEGYLFNRPPNFPTFIVADSYMVATSGNVGYKNYITSS